MICSLLVLALASVQFQVDGLHPNETWTAVAPGPSPYELDADGVWVFRGGRVVDAMTNRPIAGAKIELWTEEIDEYFGGFHQIGAAESGHDGGFIIRQREAGRHAGKMRVSAAGYSTLSAAAGEVGTEIQLYPMTPPVEVFFVDTMRRAIPNVQVTSTFTCSHDLPAYHLVSDAHGRVVLSQSGWQRDIPEMRILPPGYGAIEYFSPDKFLMPQEGDPRFEIVLPKMPTASIRILRRDGSLDSFRSFFVNEGECYHVLTSDEHGVIALPTRFGTRSASLRPLEPNYDFSESVRIDLAAALGTPLTVRPDQDWEEDVDTGALVLQCESELALSRSFGLRVWHEDGWTAYWPRHEDSNTTTLELPVGKGHVVYGSHFGEYAFEVIPFEIKAGEPKAITISPTTQTAITIEWPEETEAWWVEVGAVSTPGQSRDQPMHVPAGEPIAVHFRTEHRAYVHHYPPATDGEIITLPEPERRLAAPTVRRYIEAFHPDGSPNDQIITGARGLGERVVVDREKRDGAWVEWVEGPAGTLIHVGVGDSGYLSPLTRSRLPEVGEELPPVRFQLEKQPKLTLIGPEGWQMVGWASELSSKHENGRVLKISPGPLQLLLELPSHERFALNLELEPGEERTIRFDAN